MNSLFRKWRRHLKKLKLLDYSLIIIILLGALIFFRYIGQEKEWISIRAIAYSNILQEKSLRIGDFETDASGNKTAIVKGVEFFDAVDDRSNDFQDKTLILDLSLLVDVDKRTGRIQYKNRPVRAGSQVEFNFNNLFAQTYVAEILTDEQEAHIEYKTLTLELYNRRPWLSDSIAVGSSKIGFNKDKIVEVISKDTKPTNFANAFQGESVTAFDPSNVDINLKVKAKLQSINNSYVFQGYNQIYIGDTISFTVGNVQINDATIIKIE
jgi:hypothetical protein